MCKYRDLAPFGVKLFAYNRAGEVVASANGAGPFLGARIQFGSEQDRTGGRQLIARRKPFNISISAGSLKHLGIVIRCMEQPLLDVANERHWHLRYFVGTTAPVRRAKFLLEARVPTRVITGQPDGDVRITAP